MNENIKIKLTPTRTRVVNRTPERFERGKKGGARRKGCAHVPCHRVESVCVDSAFHRELRVHCTQHGCHRVSALRQRPRPALDASNVRKELARRPGLESANETIELRGVAIMRAPFDRNNNQLKSRVN